MEEPMCLIENNPNEQLRVNQEALKILQSIQQPVVVVAIVGLYRTGKSYLMNKLAGKDKGGFSLGPTVQAATRGIWMWCRSHPLKPDHTLVLLDTEGLGDVEKSNPENDAWIFALSILLSSTFVYNSMHTIDQYALEKLHYVSELTEHIKVKASAGQSSNRYNGMPDDFAFFSPTFIWTVRDFTLQLQLDGCPISEDEYLEHALKMKKDAPEKQDLPKKFLRQYFPNRKCFAFECPASRKDLAVLEDLPESKLSAEFVKQTHCFCSYIYENAQAKVIQGGHVVTGTSLGSLVETYVDSIRNGCMPCIENAVVALAQIENQAAMKDALNRYEAMVDLMLMPPHEDVAEVLQVHAACEEEAIKVFLARAFKDEDQARQRELGRQLQEKLEELCIRNQQASSDRCLAVLMELFQEMEERVSNGKYAVPGGYQRFLEEQKEVVEKYHLVPDKGVMASQALQDFLESKETAAQSILQADQTLTDKQKELEVEKAQAEAARREAELQRQMQEQVQQMIREKDRSYEEHKRQLLAKMDEDRRALLAANERLLNQKLQEQRRLQEEGHQQEFSRLQSQVQSLQSQIQQQKSQRSSSGRCVIS